MECPACKTENQDDARFCKNCGDKLFLTCVECETELSLDAKFCIKCGAQIREAKKVPVQEVSAGPLSTALQRLVPKEYVERLREARGTLPAERRLVTILFSDVRGSTEMGESLDPEDVMEIMNEVFPVLIEPICKYEGTLARLMGDAVLALFGAPISHEDDPERAIRAGLEIVAGAKEYAARLREERNIKGFNVRVGINTGLVVVGEVGSDLRVEYTAMGDAINLAARMEQNAPPGGVLITHDTYKLVRGAFDVLVQEPIVVKGKAEPVQTYLVERAKPRAFRVGTRGVEGIETRMVGRASELLMVKKIYQDTIEDSASQVVTVVGEAGVGKTRLIDEFVGWLDIQSEDVHYFKGRAASITQSVPYSLWQDLFAYRFGILESDRTSDALNKFRDGMGDVIEADRADIIGQYLGFEFSSSSAVSNMLGSPNFTLLAKAYLVEYFRNMLSGGPCIVVLEDLHWADDSSLDLVRHIVEKIPHYRLFVVGAARPGLYKRRPHWGEGLDSFSRVELKRLSKHASKQLTAEIFQRVEDMSWQLQDLVVDGAEGNPFYLEELVKMLVESGVIETGIDKWVVHENKLTEVRVPETLTGVLQTRLDKLPLQAKTVLQRASVVGRTFWDSLVSELAVDAVNEAEVGPSLIALRNREFVFRREKSSFIDAREYIFKHDVLRDVTYETLLLKSRRGYHRQVARWLEITAGERLGELMRMWSPTT